MVRIKDKLRKFLFLELWEIKFYVKYAIKDYYEQFKRNRYKMKTKGFFVTVDTGKQKGGVIFKYKDNYPSIHRINEICRLVCKVPRVEVLAIKEFDNMYDFRDFSGHARQQVLTDETELEINEFKENVKFIVKD